jgi:hypothetical protein
MLRRNMRAEPKSQPEPEPEQLSAAAAAPATGGGSSDGLDDYDWDEDMLFGSKPPPLQVLGAYSGARRS